MNVRAPDMVLTDIEAQVAANHVGARRIRDFLNEYMLEDLTALSEAIRGRSEVAMRRAITELPDGEYTNEVYTDGMGDPLLIKVRIEIRGDEVLVDFDGSAPQIDRGGLNCTMIYSQGHTYYPLACLLTPDVPVNEAASNRSPSPHPRARSSTAPSLCRLAHVPTPAGTFTAASSARSRKRFPGADPVRQWTDVFHKNLRSRGRWSRVQRPPVLRRRTGSNQPERRYGAETCSHPARQTCRWKCSRSTARL